MANHHAHGHSHASRAVKPLFNLGSVLCFCVLATLAHSSVQAQTLYRSVGPDGHVTFSDKPPTAAAKVTELSADGTEAGASNAALPYELRQVAGKYPVTLFTGKECAPCDEGRTLLRSRGIPFAEKTITTNEDAESLKNLSDTASLPLLTIGAQQLKGYSSVEWSQYLTAAGYPVKSKLPAGYRYADPRPLVAIKAPTSNTAPSEGARTAPAPAAATLPPSRTTPDNPAGIQF